MAVSVPALFAVICAAVSIARKVKAARVLFVITALFASAVVCCGATTTSTLHDRVEESIKNGGYGPPDFARKQWAKEIAQWHGSANGPTSAALILCAVVLAVATIPWWLRVRSKVDRPDPNPVLRQWEWVAYGALGLAYAYGFFQVLG